MKNILKVLCIVGFAVVSTTGCTTSSRVTTDYDLNHSFDPYKTFSWIGERPMLVSGDQGPNPLIASRLQTEVKSGFVEKGFGFVSEPGKADFVVSFTAGARHEIDVREYQLDDFFGSYENAWHRDRFGYLVPGARKRTILETREYTEGMLAIDVFDVAQRKPVWHGAAKKRLSKNTLESGSVESIRQAVTDILAGFPPTVTTQ